MGQSIWWFVVAEVEIDEADEADEEDVVDVRRQVELQLLHSGLLGQVDFVLAVLSTVTAMDHSLVRRDGNASQPCPP